MFCRNCGKNLEEGVNFCPECGTNNTPEAEKKADTNNFGAKLDMNNSDKNWIATLILCIFLGGWGVHRFYAGKVGTGLLMLFTCGGCGIWSIIDLIIIATGKFTDVNGKFIKSE